MEKEDEKKIRYPERPVLERGRYMEDAEAQIAASQRLAELQERKAKRERDMAIFSDIANLVTKGAAVAGGAWKIDKEEAKSAKENERLRALRDSNSKQLAEYAKLRMAAADAQRKERNAEKKAEYDAAVERVKLEENIANNKARLAELKEHNDVMEKIAQTNAETRAKNAGGSGSGSGKSTGKTKNMRYLNGWGFDIDSAVDVDEAYYRLISSNPEFQVTEDRSIAEGGGEKLVKNPDTAQKRAKLIESGLISREPAKTASVKKGSDKTMPGVGGSNNKKMPGVK